MHGIELDFKSQPNKYGHLQLYTQHMYIVTESGGYNFPGKLLDLLNDIHVHRQFSFLVSCFLLSGLLVENSIKKKLFSVYMYLHVHVHVSTCTVIKIIWVL